MATDGKKKIAALIVAGMPSPDKLKEKSGGGMNNDDDMKEDVDGGSDDDKEGKEAAEESAFADFRTASSGRDDKAGLAAFKELLSLCGYGKSGD